MDNIFTQGSNIIITIILARLLSPKEFGWIGMVTVIIGFANVFKDFGVGGAIIQRKNVDQKMLSTVFWFNVFMGLLLMSIIAASSPFVASFYREPILKNITLLLSITFFIGALNIVQQSLLQKGLNFKKIFIINFSAAVISGFIAIIMALYDYSVWSLVWKQIISVSIMCLLLWSTGKWLPQLIFDRNSFSDTMKFSLPLLGTQSLNYWVRNIDNLLIGKYLGTAALGYYSQAYRIMLIPISQISGVFSRVMFPSFSIIQDDTEKIKNIYLKLSKVISFVTFPLMFGLCAVAEPFVLSIFGTQWLPMVPVLQCLAIVGASQSVGSLNGNIFLAKGQTWYQFKVGILPRILYVLAIVWGLKYGIEGIAFFYLIAVLINSTYMYYFTGKLINLSVKAIIGNLKENILISAIIAGIMYFTSVYFTNSDFSDLTNFMMTMLFGAMLYILLQFQFNNSFVKEILNLVYTKNDSISD